MTNYLRKEDLDKEASIFYSQQNVICINIEAKLCFKIIFIFYHIPNLSVNIEMEEEMNQNEKWKQDQC